MRPAYDRLATLDEVLRRAGELSPKTLVFDVEPLVAYWDSGQEARWTRGSGPCLHGRGRSPE